jgi:hypothetical protein
MHGHQAPIPAMHHTHAPSCMCTHVHLLACTHDHALMHSLHVHVSRLPIVITS